MLGQWQPYPRMPEPDDSAVNNNAPPALLGWFVAGGAVCCAVFAAVYGYRHYSLFDGPTVPTVLVLPAMIAAAVGAFYGLILGCIVDVLRQWAWKRRHSGGKPN